jgi:hypothetical protein
LARILDNEKADILVLDVSDCFGSSIFSITEASVVLVSSTAVITSVEVSAISFKTSDLLKVSFTITSVLDMETFCSTIE